MSKVEKLDIKIRIKDKSIDKKLRKIIRQGDTSKEYRNLFKKIVEIHREEFTEENLPTMHNYLKGLLYNAIITQYKKEGAIK